MIGQIGSSDLCVRESTHGDAAGLCRELGARLCSAGELGRGEGIPEACGYDSAFAWSWAAPGDGFAECTGNGSLGIAGKPGEWFSFEAPGGLIELRLLAEGETDEATFSSSIAPDIFDGRGDLVPVLAPPTLQAKR